MVFKLGPILKVKILKWHIWSIKTDNFEVLKLFSSRWLKNLYKMTRILWFEEKSTKWMNFTEKPFFKGFQLYFYLYPLLNGFQRFFISKNFAGKDKNFRG